MRITKATGAVLSLCIIMSMYVLPYYLWVSDMQYALQFTSIFFVGILFHFLRNIEAGTEAELLFFGKSFKPKFFWEDGWCLVPSLLPALHNMGMYPLWNLKKSVDVSRLEFNPNINVSHFNDQRLPVYKVNATASLFALSMHNFFGRLLDWIFFPFTDTSELKYQRLGFRIVVLAIILAVFGNVSKDINTSMHKLNPFQEKTEKIMVTVQLNGGSSHPFPGDELFTEEGDNTTNLYSNIGDIHFIHYQKRTDGKPAYLTVKTSLCAIVPALKIIIFKTDYKPIYAVNMKDSVGYIKKQEALNILESTYMAFQKEDMYITSDDWNFVHDNWGTVDSTFHTIVAQALDQKDMADRQAKGGMVCF